MRNTRSKACASREVLHINSQKGDTIRFQIGFILDSKLGSFIGVLK